MAPRHAAVSPCASRAAWAAVGVAVVAIAARVSAVAACHPDGEPGKVEIGQPTWVCLSFNGQMFTAFRPAADTFTMLQIEESDQGVPLGTGFIRAGGGNGTAGWVTPAQKDEHPEDTYLVTVSVSSNDVDAALPKVYKFIQPGGVKRTASVMTAIISVQDGDVVAITWDEGCFFCDPKKEDCVPNTFDNSTNTVYDAAPYATCTQTDTACAEETGSYGTEGGGACDLKMYVTWTGTDVNGNFLTSAGLRFSQYRAFGVESLYDSARVGAISAYDDASTIKQNVQNNF